MRANILLFYFTISLIAMSCGKQKTCNDFRVGTFKYKDNSEGMAADIVITRTESFQIESSESANFSDTFEIVWTSDCEYYAVYQSSSNPVRMPYSKFDTVFTRIIEPKANGYVFESIFLDKRPQGELILVE